jgi:methylenetetrahydrofolate dehydrogenase (NADP+) / methenyltetrahydrofolate cyclohydrolase
MKILNGSELAEFIQERQAKDVRRLVQAAGVQPKLDIIVTVEHPAIEVYMRMKQRYGRDIGIKVDVHRVAQADVKKTIDILNEDATVHGIIVQLPLEDPTQTDVVVNMVSPSKDVDALGEKSVYQPATPMAILWLLAGYNVELRGKNIVLAGRGKLVGAPLERILTETEHSVTVVDRNTNDMVEAFKAADIIITATGQPGLITSAMIPANAVVVDAGVASEQGKTVGDLAEDVRERIDLTITPEKGGVGPLTICALFDNVLRATRATTE